MVPGGPYHRVGMSLYKESRTVFLISCRISTVHMFMYAHLDFKITS